MRREFPAKVRAAAFDRSGGFCEKIGPDGTRCGLKLHVGKFRFDHILPDYLGGEPTLENCCVQCLACDAPKTAADQTRIAKTKRQRNNHLGIRPRSRMPGSRSSNLKKRMDGTVVARGQTPGASNG